MTEQKHNEPKLRRSEGGPAMSTPEVPAATSVTEVKTVGSGDSQVPDAAAGKKGEPTNKKAKIDPQSLEQFIEYTYARKGQRLALKPKVEKQIAKNARLDEAALGRLLQVAKADTLLAVPRQILLVSQEVTGLLSLKAALSSFVSTVMLHHPVFGDAGVQSAIRNLPEGLLAADAIAKVAAYEPLPGGDTEPLKPTDLHQLRHNAVALLVTWLAVNRGFNATELSSLLFQSVWQPATKFLVDNTARMRALTDIEQVAAVGLACQNFYQQASVARAQQEKLQYEAENLHERMAAAETQFNETSAQLDALRAELLTLRENSTAEMETLRRQYADDRTHLQHKMEQLRGRLVKRLTDSVDMLEVGLSALRKDVPRIPIMIERAEHVADSLRAEIQALKEE